jgi:hypothetical protein
MAVSGRGYGATGFAAGSRVIIYGCAAETWTDAAQGTYLSFFTTATGGTTVSEKMRITSTGRVGIGTSSPGFILDVVADTTGAHQTRVYNTNTAGRSIFELASDSSSTSIYSYGSTYASSGAQQALGGMLYTSAAATGGMSIAVAAAAPIRFYTSGTSDAAERMRITSTGYLGIGKTPTTILDISENVNSSAAIRITNPNTGAASDARLTLTNDASVSSGFIIRGANHSITAEQNDAIFFVTGANNMFWYTNSVSRMSLSSAGTLNIQTTTASTSTITGALTVAGGVGIAGALYVGSTIAIGSTTVIDASRNLTNIGTISSGNVTINSSGVSGVLSLGGPASPGTSVFIQLYRAGTTTTRDAYIGYSASANLDITNEVASGNVVISPGSGGLTRINSALNIGATSVIDSSGNWVGGTIPTNEGGTGLTSIGTANQILGVNAGATGLEYKTIAAGSNITITHTANTITIASTGGGGGSGTVTSVGMTVPSFLSVTPATITTSGTFAVSLATQTANTVFAGPTTGAAAAPTFRALDIADIPTITAVKGGTGQTSYTIGDILYADTTTTLAKRAAVASGSILASAGVGTAPTWSSAITLTTSISAPIVTASGMLIVNGNGSLPAAAGTNIRIAGGYASPVVGRIFVGDGAGWKLHFSSRTGSVDTDRVTFTDAGRVGIGQDTPATLLHIAAGTATVAPLRLTSGTNLTAAVSGTVEYNGTDLFFTDATPTRKAVAFKYATTIGDNTATSFTITHNLGSRDVQVFIYALTTNSGTTNPLSTAGKQAQADITIGASSPFNATITFTKKPAVSQFRVVVIG